MTTDAAAPAGAEFRLQQLLDGALDHAIYVIDPAGNVASWSAGAERVKGYRRDEIVGRHFSRFFTPEDVAAGKPAELLAEAARAGHYEEQGWRVRKDGGRFWAQVNLDAIRHADGSLAGFAKVTRNITDRRDSEERQQQVQERFFQRQKMESLGQLTGGVAHDFNNLLTVIMGNLDIALEVLPPAPEPAMARIRRLLGQAQRSAARAATLTHRLLAFSRQQPLNPKPLVVNRLLADWSEFLARALGETIELETVGSAGLWAIEADPTQLEAAILNLAVNARDAMPEGGKLTIEAGNAYLDSDYCRAHAEVSPGQYVLIAVSDTGMGMSKEVAERAFDPFFTTKAPGKGTGLGLSMIYGFARQSHGHVRIESEVGRGTTVRLYLPRAAEEARSEPAADPVPLRAPSGGASVLAVEDNPEVRGVAVALLAELGYRVIEAADAAEALAILERGAAIDLLFTDIVMPGGMSGLELAEAARRLRPGLAVLFTSGYAEGALQPGAGALPRNLLRKPYRREELAARLGAALRGR
ncbi:MAG: PAS domain S-box protein [Rhodospirillaceae bacterium]|nr:PAS domain S-box protein [Rhodospirillaceae bacterium]